MRSREARSADTDRIFATVYEPKGYAFEFVQPDSELAEAVDEGSAFEIPGKVVRLSGATESAADLIGDLDSALGDRR